MSFPLFEARVIQVQNDLRKNGRSASYSDACREMQRRSTAKRRANRIRLKDLTMPNPAEGRMSLPPGDRD